MKTRSAIALLAVVLTQAGCKSDPTTTLIASVGAVSSASSVTIAVASSLESTGQISQQSAREIIAYAQAVSIACSKAVEAFQAGTTKKEKALNILSAVVSVQTPVLTAYGDDKARAVVAALDAALAALKIQLQAAANSSGSSGSVTVSPTRQQAREIHRIGGEAVESVHTANLWQREHRELVANR